MLNGIFNFFVIVNEEPRPKGEWKQWNEFADGEQSYECISKKLRLVHLNLQMLDSVASELEPDEPSTSPAYQLRELQQRLSSIRRAIRSGPALLCRLRLFVAVLASAFDERLSLDTALLGFLRFLYAFHKTRSSSTSLAQLSACTLEPLFSLPRDNVSRKLGRCLQSEPLLRTVLSNFAQLLSRVLFLANHVDEQYFMPHPFARVLRETLCTFVELKCPVRLECRVGLFMQLLQSLTQSAHLELQFGSPPVQSKNLVGYLRTLNRLCAQFCRFANEQNLAARAPLLSVDECLVVSEQLALLNASVLQRVELETVPSLRDNELHEQLCGYLSEVHSWHVQTALGILCLRQLQHKSPTNVAWLEAIARSLLARVLLAHECLLQFARGGRCERDDCSALTIFFRVLFEAYRVCFPKACRDRWTSANPDALAECSAAGHLCAKEALRWAFEYAIEDTLGCMLGARVCEDLVWFGEPYWTGSHVANGDLVVRRSRELADIPFAVTEHKVKDNMVRLLSVLSCTCTVLFSYLTFLW